MMQSEALRLPDRVFGDAMLVLFLLAQLADGAFTYVGVHLFGTHIEANPLIHWHVTLWGPGLAILGAKLFATVCAALLHMYEMHRTIGLLTIFYLIVAVWPWTLLMWP